MGILKIFIFRKSIKKLDTSSINLISAGEVIERPSAAVKELIENSLDANSKKIDISFSYGGKKLIRIVDDGWGISSKELELAVSSHSTSKFIGNLNEIKTFGFRGEALSSISAISKLSLKSKCSDEKDAYEVNVNAGEIVNIKPSNIQKGTCVEIQDLFFSTPARLKFLKKTSAETRAIIEVVKRAALGAPNVHFILRDLTHNGKEKIIFNFPKENLKSAMIERIGKVIGPEFIENSLEINHHYNGYKIKGLISLPTFAKPSSLNQYFYINGRVIKDRMLSAIARNTYSDFLSNNKFPILIFFIECEPSLVDVNVHPAKLEVRFSSSNDIRKLIITAIKEKLDKKGFKANTNLSRKIFKAFDNKSKTFFIKNENKVIDDKNDFKKIEVNEENLLEDYNENYNNEKNNWYSGSIQSSDDFEIENKEIFNLGVARAQIYKNYIISQSKNSLLIIDQHAAHERLLYEKMKKEYYFKKVKSQSLLIPEIIELNINDKEIILDYSEKLNNLGLFIEDFGDNSICVRAVPAILGQVDVKLLISDILKELENNGSSKQLDKKIDQILSKISCHGSIRSGRVLNSEEMNNLLREMEKTPASAQCNHGRPTFIELKLTDIEKLFGRR